jgi:hypothetical protein
LFKLSFWLSVVCPSRAASFNAGSGVNDQAWASPDGLRDGTDAPAPAWRFL